MRKFLKKLKTRAFWKEIASSIRKGVLFLLSSGKYLKGSVEMLMPPIQREEVIKADILSIIGNTSDAENWYIGTASNPNQGLKEHNVQYGDFGRTYQAPEESMAQKIKEDILSWDNPPDGERESNGSGGNTRYLYIYRKASHTKEFEAVQKSDTQMMAEHVESMCANEAKTIQELLSKKQFNPEQETVLVYIWECQKNKFQYLANIIKELDSFTGAKIERKQDKPSIVKRILQFIPKIAKFFGWIS